MSEPRNYRRAFGHWLRSGSTLRDETDAEIDAHLQMRIDDLVQSGLDPTEARGLALERFGDLTEARRQLYRGAEARNRQLRRRDRIGGIIADVRFAARQARRAPGFVAIAVLILGIGIGMTTTTLTLAERVLLRPLPFPEDEQLLSLGSVDSLQNGFPRVSAANWRDWTENSSTLASTAIHQERSISVMSDAGAVGVHAQAVTAGFFTVLRPRFIAGRGFSPADVESNEASVVVSESLWRQLLSADSTLATPLRTVEQSLRVVGVVADGSEYPAGAELWIPARIGDPGRNNINWSAIARLRGDASIGRARDELNAAAAGVHAEHPEGLYSLGVDVVPLKTLLTGDARQYLLMLIMASALVFLMACANIAAANLGRGAARSREFAVRAAIGAGKGRLMQQLLVEHLALGLAAGVLGILLARVSLDLMIARWGARIPRVAEVETDIVILGATLLLAVIAGLLTGTLPALIGSRASLSSLMATGAHGSARGGRGIPTRALVVVQIATAVVLATGSTLLLRSFSQLMSRDLGFDTEVVTVAATLSGRDYREDPELAYGYWRNLQQQLSVLPGVTKVGLTNRAPLLNGGSGFIEIEYATFPGADAGYRVVDANYFDAIGMSLVQGRAFAASDRLGAERVGVVNQAMADRYWPGTNPIGQRVRAVSMEEYFHDGTAPWIRVVGVVNNVRHYGLEDEADAEMFVHYLQVPDWARVMTAIVRPSVSADAIVRAVHGVARAVDPTIAVEVGTLRDRFREQMAERTMIVSLITIYGIAAMLLAALGTYGMLAYAVARRTRELAVRSALGADRRRLLLLVLSSAGRVAAIGIVIGVAGSQALATLLGAYLVDVAPHDSLSVLTGAAALGIVAVAASIPPAVRAARVDPLIALKAE